MRAVRNISKYVCQNYLLPQSHNFNTAAPRMPPGMPWAGNSGHGIKVLRLRKYNLVRTTLSCSRSGKSLTQCHLCQAHWIQLPWTNPNLQKPLSGPAFGQQNSSAGQRSWQLTISEENELFNEKFKGSATIHMGSYSWPRRRTSSSSATTSKRGVWASGWKGCTSCSKDWCPAGRRSSSSTKGQT